MFFLTGKSPPPNIHNINIPKLGYRQKFKILELENFLMRTFPKLENSREFSILANLKTP